MTPLGTLEGVDLSVRCPSRVRQVDRVDMAGPAERELPASCRRHVNCGRAGSAEDGPPLYGSDRNAADQLARRDLKGGPGGPNRNRKLGHPEDLVCPARRRGRDERVVLRPEHGDDVAARAKHVRHGHARRGESRACPGRERAVDDGRGARTRRDRLRGGDVRCARGAGGGLSRTQVVAPTATSRTAPVPRYQRRRRRWRASLISASASRARWPASEAPSAPSGARRSARKGTVTSL